MKAWLGLSLAAVALVGAAAIAWLPRTAAPMTAKATPPLQFAGDLTYTITVSLGAPLTGTPSQQTVQAALPYILVVDSVTATPTAVTIVILSKGPYTMPVADLLKAVSAPSGIVTMQAQGTPGASA